jgi:flagella basal body P-ring formation protein FlgA
MMRKDCEWPVAAGRAAVVLALLCAPAAAQTVQLWPTCTVQGPRIMLADVARLQGFTAADQERLGRLAIAAAAAPGGELVIHLDELRQDLRTAGVNLASIWIKGASACTVHTAAALPPAVIGPPDSGDTLALVVRRRLEEAVQPRDGDLELVFDAADQRLLDLSSPPYDFDLQLTRPAGLGPVDVRVGIRRGQEPAQPHRLRVQVSLRRDVVVAAHSLERGQVVRPDDVTLARRSFQNLEAVGMTRLDDVIGQEARRAVHGGEMLRRGDLRSVELVRRQELICVQSHDGGILIECAGRALQNGCLGDVVEVRNESSGQTYSARVSGLRQAEVILDTEVAAAGSGPQGGAP